MRKVSLTKTQAIVVISAFLLITFLVALHAVSVSIAERKRRMAFDNLNATALTRISELGVLKYRYTDVMELNRRFVVGGPSTSLVRFSGVVKAGIPDVTKIRANFDQSKKHRTHFRSAGGDYRQYRRCEFSQDLGH